MKKVILALTITKIIKTVTFINVLYNKLERLLKEPEGFR